MITAEIEQGELRQKTIETARRHKASWIELGQYLHTIQKSKSYKHWGYLAFDTYCYRELGIRQNTAVKMLRSYQFLQREEPDVIRAQQAEVDSPRNIPSVDAVNVLRLAKKNKLLTEKDISKVREDVMTEGKEPKDVRARVRKMLSERDIRDPREVRKGRRNQTLKRLITTLTATQKELDHEHLVPETLLKQMDSLIRKLEDQLE
jgi:hypothetical protein